MHARPAGVLRLVEDTDAQTALSSDIAAVLPDYKKRSEGGFFLVELVIELRLSLPVFYAREQHLNSAEACYFLSNHVRPRPECRLFQHTLITSSLC